jgi:hypothetical protein
LLQASEKAGRRYSYGMVPWLVHSMLRRLILCRPLQPPCAVAPESSSCHNVPPPTVAVPRCRMRKRINPFMPPRGNFPSPGAPKSPPQCSTPPRPCVVGRKERRRQGGNECRVRSLWRENGYGKGKDGEKGNNKMKGKNKGRNGIKYMKKKEFV